MADLMAEDQNPYKATIIDARAETEERLIDGTNDAKQIQANENDRGAWAGKFDFLMSAIAYAVGLGNVWRFPYLCFKHGGGAFLVAYAIFWGFVAVPTFLLEVAVGQYLQRGGIEVWNVCPIFKGVGLANVVITCMASGYYGIICCWAIYYLIASFSATFPWELCGQWWTDPRCLSLEQSNVSYLGANISFANDTSANTTQTSVEQFWERRVLHQSGGIGQLGGLQLELVGIAVLAWIIIYLCLCKGITKARIVVYTCALTPYFIFVVLLAYTVTLEGAGSGLYYFMAPNITHMSDYTLWMDAATQVFYSMGIGYGALAALGSYNAYRHNCYRDVLAVCAIDAGTSMLAGTVVFSILGHMATVAQVPVKSVVKTGVGLAFLSYPEAVSQLPFKQLWSVLLFLILAILGMDTQMCMMEGLSTALADIMPPHIRKHRMRLVPIPDPVKCPVKCKMSCSVKSHAKCPAKWQTVWDCPQVAIICFSVFLSGLPMVSYAGSYWVTLVDAYGASGISLCFIVLCEIIGFAYGFGADRVLDALADMLGYRLSKVWKWIWLTTAPGSCLVLLLCLIVQHKPLAYADKTPYPDWALAIGYTLSATSIVCVPGYMIYYLVFKAKGTMRQRIRCGLTAKHLPRCQFQTL